MSAERRSSRHAVVLLLIAQLAVMLPLLTVLPLWLLVIWGAVAWWYWKIVTAAYAMPVPPVKFALVALAALGIYLEYRQLLGLEPMVTLLVLAVALKLLEMKTRREHWLVLMLCYFLLGCRLLFDQQIIDVLLAVAQLCALLVAQQSLFRERNAVVPSMRLAGVMLAQALPLMLFLFVVFPRIGPLWTMPMPGSKAKTGMSDELRFGDIAELSRSGALAFRVSFDGPPPARQDLYWRGLVLEEFDGKTWRVNKFGRWSRPQAPVIERNAAREYTVTLEPGVHSWLYTLPVANISRNDLLYAGAYQWAPKQPLSGRLQYRVYSNTAQPRTEVDMMMLRRNLRLPEGINPQSRALAQRWSQQYATGNERLNAALRFYLQQSLIYTLNPPTLGEDSVDAFLFQTRQGFCEHFAASFVFLMRAAGVPARVVVGYQGGEYNATDNYLLVHESDAHAWAEVWLEGSGWQRVDPTALVTPDRLRLGAESLLRDQQGFLAGSPLSLRRFAWANTLRLYMDNLNYAWARWVLNYDRDSQSLVLVDILGLVTPQRLIIALLLCGGLPLLLYAVVVFLPGRNRSEDLATRYYMQACQQLAKRGVGREPGETPRAFLQRVERSAPEWAPWLRELTQCFEGQQYHSEKSAEDALKALRRLRRPRKVASSAKGVGKT